MLIDIHNHYYPPAYLDALREPDSVVRLTEDSSGNPCVHYPGDYNVAVRGHRDIAYRQTVLEHEGVDTQVITLTTPGTHVDLGTNLQQKFHHLQVCITCSQMERSVLAIVR